MPGPESGASPLEAFLTTDPRDAGCAETWRLIDVYVDIAARGGDPEATYPGIAAHLRACPPCADDHEGLVNALMTAERAARDRQD